MKFKVWSPVFAFLLSLMLVPSLRAQYYFGRNKVQYDNFEWKILKTEHFDVYFYPEMLQLAEMGAAFAEEAYTRLEGKFNHNITRRIPLIFYSNHSHFQQTNTTPGFIPEGVGGFFEFLKGRVVIPSNGSIHDFKHVINHELVHVFHRSLSGRVLKDHRRTAFYNMPLWFTEGLAEYWSEGWDSQAEMFIRDAVLNGHLVPLSRMYQIYGTFMMYKEGQAICKFISENFGEEKLLQLIQNSWKETNFSALMKLTIGLNFEEFDKQWVYDLKKKYYPLMEDGDSPKMVTQVITEDGINTKPTAFKLGEKEWTAFVSNRVGYSNIYIKELDEPKKASVLIKGERTSDFESFHLLRSKIDGHDSGKLTFVSKSGSADALYVYDIERKKIVHRFQFEKLVSLASPNWAPDGKRIVFSGISYPGLNDLYIVNIESGELERLTNDYYSDRDPAWSPDGRVIVFSSDRSSFGKDGFMNLFLYSLDDGQIKYVTKGRHNDYAPAWSPNGESLAFTSDRDGQFNIWVIQDRKVKTAQNADDDLKMASMANETFREVVKSKMDIPDAASSYPAAVEESDTLRRVTSFTTGAFDPVWVNDDEMLFAAFENATFQLRKINDLGEKIQDAEVANGDTLITNADYWTAKQLAGEVQSTTIKYKKRFSLDIAQSAVSHDPIFGATGGALLGISDMLGNQKYYFLFYNNAQRRSEFLHSWNVAVTRVDVSKRSNYAVGLYRLSGVYYDRKDSFFERSQLGGFVSASYPFSVFKRIEGTTNIRKERRDYDFRGTTVNGIVVSNSLSYVKDNSIWGWTGPMDGERYNLTIGHTIDVQHNDVHFATVSVDFRKYFRLSQRSAFATRATAHLNIGHESFRYFMGGSWDLRLWPRWSIWGRKLFLVSNEVRMPFLDRFLLGFPFGGFGFQAIRGAAFFDVGQAWDSEYDFENVLGSVGFGWRLRLGAFLVLRYEIGRRFTANSFGNIQWEDGLKDAFWFGFDF